MDHSEGGSSVDAQASWIVAGTKDGPFARPVDATITGGIARNNLMIVLDTSGSMANEGRLVASKAALANLVDAYDDLGEVSVRLVTFDSAGREV